VLEKNRNETQAVPSRTKGKGTVWGNPMRRKSNASMLRMGRDNANRMNSKEMNGGKGGLGRSCKTTLLAGGRGGKGAIPLERGGDGCVLLKR